MQNKLSDIWRLAMVYVGSVVGAGFASGQELWQFFGVHGLWGIIAIALVGVVFAAMGYGVITICQRQNINNFSQFFQEVLPHPWHILMTWLLRLFICAIVGVMLAASGALVEEQWQIHPIYGIGSLWLLLLISLNLPEETLLKIQSRLITPLVIILLFTGVTAIYQGWDIDLIHLGEQPAKAFVSAWLYVGYNLLGSIGMLIALKNHNAKGGLLGGILLGVMALFLVIPLCLYGGLAANYQIPLLALSSQISSSFYYIYGIILAIAIFTTAFTSAYALVGNAKFPLQLAFLLIVLPLGLGDFSKLVGHLYSLFGFGGGLCLLGIFLYLCKKP